MDKSWQSFILLINIVDELYFLISRIRPDLFTDAISLPIKKAVAHLS